MGAPAAWAAGFERHAARLHQLAQPCADLHRRVNRAAAVAHDPGDASPCRAASAPVLKSALRLIHGNVKPLRAGRGGAMQGGLAGGVPFVDIQSLSSRRVMIRRFGCAEAVIIAPRLSAPPSAACCRRGAAIRGSAPPASARRRCHVVLRADRRRGVRLPPRRNSTRWQRASGCGRRCGRSIGALVQRQLLSASAVVHLRSWLAAWALLETAHVHGGVEHRAAS